MSTSSPNTRIRHDSDAMFQEWATELHAQFVAVGLVQTADTGQINTATATRSAVNTLTAGYSCWGFNDTLQTTSPIYFRVDFGTGSSSNQPRFAITVGTGTDGAGNITGDAVTAQRALQIGAAGTTDTLRQSHFCHTEGFFGFMWKIGSSSSNAAAFIIARTNDNAGNFNGDGALVCWSNSTVVGVRQVLRFVSPATAFTAKGGANDEEFCALGFCPQIPASSAFGADTQVFLGWIGVDRILPLISVCGQYLADGADESTFTVTLFGSISHTYMVMPSNIGAFGPVPRSDTGGLAVCMLWE